MTKAITMWRFEDAPAILRALSTNGGDEDWLAIVPKSIIKDGLPSFMHSTSFGACGIDTAEYPGLLNDIIVIAYHS
jgi:hypothetical protein